MEKLFIPSVKPEYFYFLEYTSQANEKSRGLLKAYAMTHKCHPIHAMADAFSDSVLMDCCGKHMQIFGSDYFIPKNDHCIRRTFPHNGIAYSVKYFH